jgi:hypothetical protein
MTLLELLIAMSIMVIVVGTLGALSKGVQEGFEYTEGRGLATQHARVLLDRIGGTVREATANEQFPGVIVLSETVGSQRFPDTLVVWHPASDPVDADGLPRYNELVVYCPGPTAPNQFVEITVPADTRTVPPVASQAQWAAEIEAIKQSDSSEVVVLTDLVRTGSADDSEAASWKWRGAVRFETRLRPSQTDWAAYQDSTLNWEELPWVQGIYGSQTGLRQVWVRTELQLTTGETAGGGGQYLPFLGSAALHYEMNK